MVPDCGEALQGWQRRYAPGADGELRQQVESLPSVVAETQPGDVTVFGTHTWHASTRGHRRRQWTVASFVDPQTEAETSAFRAHVASEAKWLATGGGRIYDRDRYPFYDPSWMDERRDACTGVSVAASRHERTATSLVISAPGPGTDPDLGECFCQRIRLSAAPRRSACWRVLLR
ncbi:MAG: hypothetical protein M3336_06765 [Chloroflexota bacterium]|nr:hypothetical protein [Chloroflexota bacterium]